MLDHDAKLTCTTSVCEGPEDRQGRKTGRSPADRRQITGSRRSGCSAAASHACRPTGNRALATPLCLLRADRRVRCLSRRACRYLSDPLEVDVAEAVQPATDLRLELEVMQAPHPAAHAWPGYRVCSRTQPDRDRILPGRRASGPGGISSLAAGASCGTPSARHGMYPEPRRAGHRRPREHLAHLETCRCVDPRSAAASGPLVIEH
jgi:hypothetical protein